MPAEEVYQWTPDGVDGMVGGGAGIVYEYECIEGAGARWTVSFDPLGAIAGMSDGRRNSSGEDLLAVFRTTAASPGVAVVPGGQIRGETVNAASCADMMQD